MADLENNTSLITGKALDRYFAFNKAHFEFHNLFNLENKDERAIAILGATFLEMALEHILYTFFPEDDKEVVKLFEYNQPLGDFRSKISLCYCLDLIDKMIKDDLNTVRKIRNKFAYDLYANFEDEQVKSWSSNLKFHRVSMMMDAPDGATALQVFQVGINQVISNLSGCISREEKRVIKDDFRDF